MLWAAFRESIRILHMKSSSIAAFLVASLSSVAFAYDSDPGYGSRSESGTFRPKSRTNAPAYFYKPTQRYYGKGYVVTYRFVQWNDRMGRIGTTVFDGFQYNVPAASVREGSGVAPKITYHQAPELSTGASSPAAAPTPKSVVTTPAKEVPPIAEEKK